MANKQGFFYYEIYMYIFCAILVFIVFYYLIHFVGFSYNIVLEDAIVTQNALSKSNPGGAGFAIYDFSKKHILTNFVSAVSVEEPIKYIKVETIDGIITEDGNTGFGCVNSKIQIERFGYYQSKIAKFIFGFCE